MHLLVKGCIRQGLEVSDLCPDVQNALVDWSAIFIHSTGYNGLRFTQVITKYYLLTYILTYLGANSITSTDLLCTGCTSTNPQV